MNYTNIQLKLIKVLLINNAKINDLRTYFQKKYINAFDKKFFSIVAVFGRYYQRKETINESNFLKVLLHEGYGQIESEELFSKLQGVTVDKNIQTIYQEIYDEYVINQQNILLAEMSKTTDPKVRQDIFYKMGLLMQEQGDTSVEFVSETDMSNTMDALFEEYQSGEETTINFFHMPELSEVISKSMIRGRGNLLSIIGNTGGGKTAISLYLTTEFTLNRHIANKKYGMDITQVPTAYISTEMVKEQFAERLMSMYMGVPNDEIRKNPTQYKEDYNKWKEVQKELKLKTFFIRKNQFEDNLFNLIRQAKVIYGSEVVIVDYFQSFKVRDSRDPMYVQLTNMMNALADLAADLGIKIIVTMQMNREAEGKDFSQINKGMTAGSYDSLRACDVVLMIGKTPREEYEERVDLGNRRIKVEKNRNGRIDNIVIRANMNDYNMQWETVGPNSIDWNSSGYNEELVKSNPHNNKMNAEDKLANILKYGMGLSEKKDNTKQESLNIEIPVTNVKNDIISDIETDLLELESEFASEIEFEWE